MSVFVRRSDFYKSVFRKNRVIVGKNILVRIEAKLNICYLICVTYVVKVIFFKKLVNCNSSLLSFVCKRYGVRYNAFVLSCIRECNICLLYTSDAADE